MTVAGERPLGSLDAVVPWRLAAAIAVGIATLAGLLFVLLGRPLTHLPDYPAVVLAFVVAFVLPGLLVQPALLSGRNVDPPVRLAVAPVLGLAMAAIPGFIALEAHTSLENFIVLYASFAAMCCGVSTLFWRRAERSEAAEPRSQDGSVLLIAMIAIALGGIVSMPFWAKGRMTADYDDWTYMAYVRSYTDQSHMNSEEPFLGTGASVTPRMRDNIWVLSEALVSKTAGVPPEEVLLEFLKPVLIVAVLLGVYALTQTLFSNRTVALLSVAFLLGYALIDLAPHEGFGVNLFIRITEDKMIAAFYLLPVALIFLARFLARPHPSSYVGFSAIILGLSFVHPVPLFFVATTLVTLGVLRICVDRSLKEVRSFALLLAPVALASLWPFVQRQLLVHIAAGLFSVDANSITYRNQFHVKELSMGLLIGDVHMILHPLVLATILLAPAVWLMSKRSLANQLLASMTIGALVVFFFPPIATPVAKVMTPQTLWKMPWMIPVAPTLAYVMYRGVSWAANSPFLTPRRVSRFAVFAVAPALLVALSLVAALAVQEQYARRDGGAFYAAETSSAFPGQNTSIFMGGIHGAFAATWRQSPDSTLLFAYLQNRVPENSVILAEPTWLNHMMPGRLTRVFPVDFGGTAGEGQRRESVNDFVSGNLTKDSAQLGAVIDHWGIDYIITPEVSNEDRDLLQYPRASLLVEIGAYAIFKVR